MGRGHAARRGLAVRARAAVALAAPRQLGGDARGAGASRRPTPPTASSCSPAPASAPGRLRDGRLADVTATVLYLLELPVARDMAGRVLLDAVSEERASAVPLR